MIVTITVDVSKLTDEEIMKYNKYPGFPRLCKECRVLLDNKNQYLHKNGSGTVSGSLSNWCKSCILDRQQRIRRERRASILKEYGNKCACCGSTDQRTLDIDHIHNDGAQERRHHPDIPLWVIKQNYPKDRYQLLCKNCNRTKMILQGKPCNCQDPNSRILSVTRGRKPKNVNRKFSNVKDAICNTCRIPLNETNCYFYLQALQGTKKIQFKCIPCLRKYKSDCFIENRRKVLEAYGAKCSDCNWDHPLSLEIDHINNDGRTDRTVNGIKNFYVHLIRNKYPKDKYQILCACCNYLKYLEHSGKTTTNNLPITTTE